MKAKLIFFIFIFLFLNSCEHRDKEIENAGDKSYIALNKDLVVYVDSFNNENKIPVQTRKGFWKWFWKVVKADALGALGGLSGGAKGAIIGAVVGSGKAILMSSQVIDNDRKYGVCYLDEDDKVSFDDMSTELDISKLDLKGHVSSSRIGELHNICLSEISPQLDSLKSGHLKLMNGDIQSLRTKGREEVVAQKNVTEYLTDVVSEKIETMVRVKVSELEKIAIGQSIDKINECIVEDDYKKLQDFFNEKGLKEHYIVVEMYISNVERIGANVNDASTLLKYTEGYLDIIKKSTIPKKDIESICSSIMVAVNSTLYWDSKK